MLDRDPTHAGSGDLARCVDSLLGARLERLEATLVDRVRDEPADVGVHAPRLVDEETAVGRDRSILAEKMLEDR